MHNETFVDGLTKILVKRKLVSEKEAKALQQSFHDSPKSNFDEFLMQEGLVDKDDLLPALADYYQVPFFDACGYFFDHQLVRLFPKIFLRSNEIIPIEVDENMLIVLASDPSLENLVPRINTYVSYDIQFQVGIRQDILDAIDEFYDQSPSATDYAEDVDEETENDLEELERERDVESMSYEDFGSDLD